MDHIQNNSSNLHLQSAIVKYGLSHFAFVILENCIPSDLLKREQHFLDILFSLPANLRYNFARFTEASFKGLTHTPESKALISASMTGKSHSDETRAKMSEGQTGENNPMYGRTGALNPMYGKSGELSPVSIQVYVYSIDNVLIGTFSSQVACAKWLGVSNITVSRYIRSGKIFQGKYLLTPAGSPI
jgi:group I intron endonuclease